MKSLTEIKDSLRNALSLDFSYMGKDGYVDCCYNTELEKRVYHLRYGTDEYDVTTEDEVFTLPFVAGRSLSEIYEDIELQPC